MRKWQACCGKIPINALVVFAQEDTSGRFSSKAFSSSPYNNNFVLLLRWIIGASCVAALGLFGLVLIVGKGIRSAYQSGAGTGEFLRAVAVYAIPFLLAAMLASVLRPESTRLLHVVAAAVALGMLGCIAVMREAPGEGGLYLGFLGLWMIYYLFTIYN